MSMAMKNVRNPKSVLTEFLELRDYKGSETVLDYLNFSRKQHQLWKAYFHFQNEKYDEAQQLYLALLETADNPDENSLFLSCCYFHQKLYDEAMETLENVQSESPLKVRLQIHLGNKMKRDVKIHVEQLSSSIEDQLSDAALLYDTGCYQDAADAYNNLLDKNPEHVCLNVFVSLCHFKNDYYDVAQESLSVYEQEHSDSIFVKNLKACITFRLVNGSAALDELIGVDLDNLVHTNNLLRHNMVVFTDGEKALQTLPPLVNIIPEAKLNLAIHYLRENEIKEAEFLLKDLIADSSQERLLKGVLKATLAQMVGDNAMLKEAQSLFESVGESPSEADTIPGRIAQASALFLEGRYTDANVFLSSIKSYLSDNDEFHWNYGISLASAGDYFTAEETLLLIQDDSYLANVDYKKWLSRCFVMNRKEYQAWELNPSIDSIKDRVSFLIVLADDCFQAGRFEVASKAFDALQDLDSNEDFALGLKSSCLAVFRSAMIGKDSKSKNALPGTVRMLQARLSPSELRNILPPLEKWMRSNITIQ